MFIYKGLNIGFVLSLAFIAALLYGIRYMKNRKIRVIPGLEAIDEAVGRAVELGRPVHDCPGGGTLIDYTAPQTIAGIAIIGYLAKLCAQKGAELMVTINVAHTLPAIEEIIRTNYLREGKIEQYSPEIVRFLPDQVSLFSYCMEAFETRQIAANVLVGAYFWEAIVLSEYGGSVGAMQIGGTARQSQLPAFVASCDYLLIGDEMYASAAKVSDNKAQIGSIAGQDLTRAIVIVLMIIAVLAALIGNRDVLNFLKI